MTLVSLCTERHTFIMPGPKMGPRPPDFNEATIRLSPTFQKWASLPDGAKLRYACREFLKGHGDDEERLMRRIMIARRNNLRDHEVLKKARQQSKTTTTNGDQPASVVPTKKRKATCSMSDSQVSKEMDVSAVEATRSYRKWMTLEEGQEFVYNQKYVKGKDGHDWLLRKNIWRRMRYRRENKKMVETLKEEEDDDDEHPEVAAGIVDHALLANTTSAEPADFTKSAVEAAVAAAEQYVKTSDVMAISSVVHNPLEAAATDEALAAAAKIAAAVAGGDDDEEEEVAKIAAAVGTTREEEIAVKLEVTEV